MFRIRLILLAALTLALSTSDLSQQPPSQPDPSAGQQMVRVFDTSDRASVPYLLDLPNEYDGKQRLPIWVFHDDQDRAVPFFALGRNGQRDQGAVGTSIRFTTFEERGLNCWSAAYATPLLYDWLSKQIHSN